MKQTFPQPGKTQKAKKQLRPTNMKQSKQWLETKCPNKPKELKQPQQTTRKTSLETKIKPKQPPHMLHRAKRRENRFELSTILKRGKKFSSSYWI